jgi:nicotinamide-nucleotide amidase
MNAQIITIGDEILIGQIVDTNSAWIAKELNKLGISVSKIISIGDDASEIQQTITEALHSSKIVIITGGLGPTNDDITKNVLCQIFNSELVLNSYVLENIKFLLDKRNIPLNENNRSQALVPDKAKVLNNLIGTAPGLMFEKNDKILFSLPGVPYEMKYIFSEHVINELQNKFQLLSNFHKTILTAGLAESVLAEKIQEWENSIPKNIKLAYLPSPGFIRLRLSKNNADKAEIETINLLVEKLKTLIPENIIATEDIRLEEVLGNLLKQNNKTICTAESCTGGKIASLITGIPGSSAYFEGSIIAYSNQIKVKELSVNPETLQIHGAVSEQTVIEMAENIRKKFNTDYSVAVSGIAGPDGGSKQKPVGTIWIAVSNTEKTLTKRLLFPFDRITNIERTANTALLLLINFIMHGKI